jgi:5-(carboxyamino)imidazole ribonucleotide synthase
LDGAVTGQFEQHVRAVCGLPLGDPSAIGVTTMLNCIGGLPDPAAVLAVPGAHLHVYDKAPRAARKVGHVNVTAPDDGELRARLALLADIVPFVV